MLCGHEPRVWPWGGSQEVVSAGLGEQRHVTEALLGWVAAVVLRPFGSRRLSASAPRWTQGCPAGHGSHVIVLAEGCCVPMGCTGWFLEAPVWAAAAHMASLPSERGCGRLWLCVDCAEGLLILTCAGSA